MPRVPVHAATARPGRSVVCLYLPLLSRCEYLLRCTEADTAGTAQLHCLAGTKGVRLTPKTPSAAHPVSASPLVPAWETGACKVWAQAAQGKNQAKPLAPVLVLYLDTPYHVLVLWTPLLSVPFGTTHAFSPCPWPTPKVRILLRVTTPAPAPLLSNTSGLYLGCTSATAHVNQSQSSNFAKPKTPDAAKSRCLPAESLGSGLIRGLPDEFAAASVSFLSVFRLSPPLCSFARPHTEAPGSPLSGVNVHELTSPTLI